ncbi:hypothetical protein ABZX65_27135 [Streptomyces sp. NPDC003300]|uniref:hypothetical protein n=1 Tax=unclassified Streptomyces TaxID=2593676 RepID=UPI0033BA5E45
MTVDGLLYNPTIPDPAVLTIDGPEFYATDWAAGLDPISRHIPGCYLGDLGLQDACACQPPL